MLLFGALGGTDPFETIYFASLLLRVEVVRALASLILS